MEPLRTAIVGGYGRVGGSLGLALRAAGWPVELVGRADILAPEDLVIVAVPDDVLPDTIGKVAAHIRPGTAVVHTCGIEGAKVLRACGERVSAIHPAFPVPTSDTSFDGMFFGVTCAPEMREWSHSFVRVLGGEPVDVPEDERVLYHAALSMTSNFAMAIAGDAGELLHGDHRLLIPLLRAMVDAVERLGPDHALTGAASRGDAGTIERHLDALPHHLREMYIANTRRIVSRALTAGLLDLDPAERVAELLDREVQL